MLDRHYDARKILCEKVLCSLGVLLESYVVLCDYCVCIVYVCIA